MEQLTNGTMENLKAMFSFRSENFVSGTGELRCWIAVAGAVHRVKQGHRAVKIDYVPAPEGHYGFRMGLLATNRRQGIDWCGSLGSANRKEPLN